MSAQPDASKVRVSGPGVEHGILATFQSRFVVETRGAGAGQLTVRIRGPKGEFRLVLHLSVGLKYQLRHILYLCGLKVSVTSHFVPLWAHG